jgi:hypothetical protein
METVANTNINIYTSDACIVLTNSPQNIDDFLLSTGHYSISRGTKAQKNVKCTVERIMKNWPRGTGCQLQSTSVQRTCVQKKLCTGILCTHRARSHKLRVLFFGVLQPVLFVHSCAGGNRRSFLQPYCFLDELVFFKGGSE